MKKVTSWGRYPEVKAQIFSPSSIEETCALLRSDKAFTLRGNGRSYGDAALGPHLLDLRKLNQIIDFQEDTGILTCHAGVLLADLIDFIVPKGWFFHVTPGIKSITIGGAIASNVHGKNHPVAGCFSDWVLSFDILLADGNLVTCSPTQHSALFNASFGAMGWTGAVVQVSFQLKRISSTQMTQRTSTCQGIGQLLEALSEAPEDYAAAWLDLTNQYLPHTIRGVLYAADHVHEPQALVYKKKPVLSIPFTPPFNCLQPWLMRQYNRQIWKTAQRKTKHTERITIDQYFYPLDSIAHWNRLYGPAGFVQYQCCLPLSQAQNAFEQLLQAISDMPYKPYLVVVKRHGAANSRFPNSFPIEGYSIAMDWPANSETIKHLKALDTLVWNLGGKVYLTKDALSHGRMSRLDWQSLEPFLSEKFSSIQQARIKNDMAL